MGECGSSWSCSRTFRSYRVAGTAPRLPVFLTPDGDVCQGQSIEICRFAPVHTLTDKNCSGWWDNHSSGDRARFWLRAINTSAVFWSETVLGSFRCWCKLFARCRCTLNRCLTPTTVLATAGGSRSCLSPPSGKKHLCIQQQHSGWKTQASQQPRQ